MAAKIDKKVALVTGGSQGIGRAISTAFAKSGYTVIICARTAEDVEKAATELSSLGGRCEGLVLDVSDAEAIRSAVSTVAESYGRIDVLVACAGIYGPIGVLEENDSSAWERAIRVNLCGTVFTVQAVLPTMKKQGNGCIITLAGGGVGGPSIKPNFSSYVTSKFAICGFTEAVSKELAGTGVRINAISPGAVNTRLLEEVLSSGKKAGKAFYESSKKQKETGGTSPWVAAEFALFLASDVAKHINGKVLSAVWDKKEKLSSMKDEMNGSVYTLRRIDSALFWEKKKQA